MDVAQREPGAHLISPSLAGLEAGMIAALWMLAWLGLSAAWQRSSFWTPENLFASTFYGARAIKSGFSHTTVSGLALYLLIYSALGGLFAAAIRTRLARPQLLLAAVVVAVGWYYLSFHGVWKAVNPLVTLLHAERPAVLGHVIYGAVLARFPRYLRPAPAPEEAAAVTADVPAAVASADGEPANRTEP